MKQKDYNVEDDDYEVEDYEYDDPQPRDKKNLLGYQIVIVILAAILVTVSLLYFSHMKQIEREYAIERDTLTNRLTNIMADMDSLHTENAEITQNLDMERNRADSLMDRLKRERTLSSAKIRQYEHQLGLMRETMKSYYRQIDSLNSLNKQLIKENVNYRREVATHRKRAEVAEERAEELTTKVRQGAVVQARDIAIVMLSSSDKEVTRAQRAARLRVEFVISANALAEPGERRVYVRILGPDGYIMANDASQTFEFEGDNLTFSASREIDYQNQDLDISVYYNGGGITAGTYTVSIFMDGYQIGSTKTILR